MLPKLKHRNELKDNKIPNFKYQITNNSQNPIFNDQNIHRNRFANPGLPVMISVDTTIEGSFAWNFEFESL